MTADAMPPPGIDTGLACLIQLLAFHEIRADARQIEHDYVANVGAMTLDEMILTARAYELKVKRTRLTARSLPRQTFPLIAAMPSGTFVMIGACQDGQVLMQAPGGQPQNVPLEQLLTAWDGTALLGARRASKIIEEVRFGLSWFLPVIFRYKRLFAEIFVASFFIQLFGLITPLVFQVVIDKVLVHQGLTTLNVLVIALVSMTVFEAVLGYLRTFIMSHTTSRIDAQLGSKLFGHLLSLPISYFERRAAGQTVARVRELENVRDFITGNGLTSVLDLLFTVIFFAVMWIFSPTLTLIVAGSIPFYVLLSILITPELRKRIEEKFQRGARNQSFLVEAVSGAETLKAMAIEPQMRRRWDENLAAYVKSSFRTIALGAAGSQTVQMINKLVTALLLFIGAKLVIGGELTVGQLVAFNMLAGQVSQPILRIAQLWQDFQQFSISIQKLGDILNATPEVKEASVPENLPPLNGQVTFEHVRFRYDPNEPEVLKNLSFDIKPGEMIGFVGRSGSGKSTITKLIQRLHVPDQGQVLLDGINMSLLHPAWLRRQVGVVLQENVLFSRTIRENIALADPSAPMDTVVRAATLAGADDFIKAMPRGYDSVLEERGSNLSGGQRQRIAIARALITDPRILIFDEATSALDLESERMIQANMAEITQGRTVIIVAHRLTAVKGADRIFVMDKGEIVESGSHQALMLQGGMYAHLFRNAS